MVQRYFPDVEGDMVSVDTGAWVAYEDYAALEDAYRCAQDEIKQLREFIANLPKGVK